MANYAVLTYKYLQNKPFGVPDGYPAIVQGLGQATGPLPPGDGWQLMNDTQLAAARSAYQNGFNRISQKTATDDLTKRVLAAMDFGRLLLAKIAAQNLALGLTKDQILDVMTKGQAVTQALSLGSLYIALDALAAITPDDVLTADKITDVRNQIQDYLGIPRT